MTKHKIAKKDKSLKKPKEMNETNETKNIMNRKNHEDSENTIQNEIYKLHVVIVHHGLGTKVIHIAKESGIPGGTVIFGKGTAQNPILKFLALADYRKEIVLVLGKESHGAEFLKKVTEKLKFYKPNSGIAFSIPVNQIIGSKYGSNVRPEGNISGGEKMDMYHSIFVIVDRGNAKEVVDAANESGAKGATVINARGSGIHETSKLFAFDIEPEKEIVLILVKRDITETVTKAIKERSSIAEAGKGIMFVQSVDEVYGIQ